MSAFHPKGNYDDYLPQSLGIIPQRRTINRDGAWRISRYNYRLARSLRRAALWRRRRVSEGWPDACVTPTLSDGDSDGKHAQNPSCLPRAIHQTGGNVSLNVSFP